MDPATEHPALQFALKRVDEMVARSHVTHAIRYIDECLYILASAIEASHMRMGKPHPLDPKPVTHGALVTFRGKLLERKRELEA